MREKYFKNDTIEMWIENGILHGVYAPYAVITLEVARINVAERLKIADGKTYPVCVDFTKAKTASREARSYFSAGDGIRGISAGAFLVKTEIEAFLLNTWLKLYKPKVPAKLFTEKEEALEWLEPFKRIN